MVVARPSWSNWWEERRKRKEKEKHDQKFRDQEAAIRQRNRNALLKMPASAFQGAAAEHSGYLWKQGKGFWKRFDKRWFVLIPGEVPGTKMLLCETAARRPPFHLARRIDHLTQPCWCLTDFDSPKSKAPKTLITSQQGGVFPISKPKLDKQERAKFQHNFRIETGGDGDSHYILAAESKKLKKQWLAALQNQILSPLERESPRPLLLLSSSPSQPDACGQGPSPSCGWAWMA